MSNASLTVQPSPGPVLVEKDLSYTIVGAFFEVYNTLGVGFVESIYSRALDVALRRRGLVVQREAPTVVFFQGVEVGTHRADMLVEGRIIVELKATERVADVAKRQVRSYLAAFDLELGLILHFGARAEVHRILRRLQSQPNPSHAPNCEAAHSITS